MGGDMAARSGGGRRGAVRPGIRAVGRVRRVSAGVRVDRRAADEVSKRERGEAAREKIGWVIEFGYVAAVGALVPASPGPVVGKNCVYPFL
jgi:hypothetical protein